MISSRGMGAIAPKKRPNKHHKHKAGDVPHSNYPPVFDDSMHRTTK